MSLGRTTIVLAIATLALFVSSAQADDFAAQLNATTPEAYEIKIVAPEGVSIMDAKLNSEEHANGRILYIQGGNVTTKTMLFWDCTGGVELKSVDEADNSIILRALRQTGGDDANADDESDAYTKAVEGKRRTLGLGAWISGLLSQQTEGRYYFDLVLRGDVDSEHMGMSVLPEARSLRVFGHTVSGLMLHSFVLPEDVELNAPTQASVVDGNIVRVSIFRKGSAEATAAIAEAAAAKEAAAAEQAAAAAAATPSTPPPVAGKDLTPSRSAALAAAEEALAQKQAAEAAAAAQAAAGGATEGQAPATEEAAVDAEGVSESEAPTGPIVPVVVEDGETELTLKYEAVLPNPVAAVVNKRLVIGELSNLYDFAAALQTGIVAKHEDAGNGMIRAILTFPKAK